MNTSWIERVNTESNIHNFITEEFLVNRLRTDDVSELNWMRIFNSKIILSNAFIVDYIENIKWNWLTRRIDESLLTRYQSRVVQWNSQLYGPSRTFEFLSIHRHRFDWPLLSLSPPDWFNDVHFEEFGSLMDWTQLTKFSKKMDIRTISKYANRINWEWISANDIRGESFAQRFITLINWDHPQLDTSRFSAPEYI